LECYSHWGDPERYPFPGSIQAPIPHFRIAFPGSSRSGVHAHRKYRFKWLFSKNTRFNQDLPLQNSGLLLASFFSVYHSRIFGRIGQQMPLAARYCDHVGEFVFLGHLRVLSICRYFCFAGECVYRFCRKCFLGFFSHAKIFFPDFAIKISKSTDNRSDKRNLIIACTRFIAHVQSLAISYE
jgi:hypothetical protein